MRASDARQQVVDLCLLLSKRGYFSGTGGNLALRIDTDHFAVTPSATDYLTMRAEDICVMRLSDLQCVEGSRTPSVETGLHARVLRQRKDAMCSIHTHQPVASACTLLGVTLQVQDPAAQRILGHQIPLVGYMPSGSGLLSYLVGKALRPDINAYLMRNHGVLCCGESIATALLAVDTLEQVARDWLGAQMREQSRAKPARAAVLKALLQSLAP